MREQQGVQLAAVVDDPKVKALKNTWTFFTPIGLLTILTGVILVFIGLLVLC